MEKALFGLTPTDVSRLAYDYATKLGIDHKFNTEAKVTGPDWYNLAADTWMVSNPGKRITFFEMAGIFITAYNKSATIEKAVNGFRVCGLWPFNAQIFDEEDFIASGVTEEPSPAAEGIHQNEGNLEGNRDPQATMGHTFRAT